MNDLPKPGYVRALTWEQMSPAQRELYERPPPRRRRYDFECDWDYDILKKFDSEIPSFHRVKNDD